MTQVMDLWLSNMESTVLQTGSGRIVWSRSEFKNTSSKAYVLWYMLKVLPIRTTLKLLAAKIFRKPSTKPIANEDVGEE